jgi:hypothetical protein
MCDRNLARPPYSVNNLIPYFQKPCALDPSTGLSSVAIVVKCPFFEIVSFDVRRKPLQPIRRGNIASYRGKKSLTHLEIWLVSNANDKMVDNEGGAHFCRLCCG